MSDDAAPDYELKVPFVVVKSEGGPYDDDAYVAGYEMGRLAAQLEVAVTMMLGPPRLSIHDANVPQADLLAMQMGARLEVEGSEDGWTWLTFEWPDDEGGEVAG